MNFSSEYRDNQGQIVALYRDVFTASEGADEGAAAGKLVTDLLGTTPPRELKVFTGYDGQQLIAAAVFTRLTYANDPRSVFILSPMAVATHHQAKGLGKALINHALDDLRRADVDVVITYGDPAFYGKVGFKSLDQTQVAPPLGLSMPHGWIGQSLTHSPLKSISGACSCVPALNNPAIW